MKTRVILTIVMVSLSMVAAMLPQKKNSSSQLNAEELLQEIRLETYKISPDRLSDIIINKDPSYMLIDIRPVSEFEKFSLPGSINIPFDSIFTDNWIAYFDQDLRKNILYSNGSTLTSQALLLTRQKGFKNNFILEGGLNGWFDGILNVKPPANSEDKLAQVKYERRLAAKQYFKGGNVQVEKDSNKAIKPIPQRKKKTVQGGCS